LGLLPANEGFIAAQPVYNSDSAVIGVAVIKMGFGFIEDRFDQFGHGIIMLSPDQVVFATNYRPWLFNTTRLKVITDSSLQYNKTSIAQFPFDLSKNKLVSDKKTYLVINNHVGDADWQIISLCPKDPDYPIQDYLIKLTLIFIFSVLILFTIILVLIINIRLRHNAQKALKINEEDLETTLNSLADAVIAADLNGFVTRMNPVAQTFTGFKIQKQKENISAKLFFSKIRKIIKRYKFPIAT
jgi:C4-dicarboxylate-specific signal transduction histidine kinase